MDGINCACLLVQRICKKSCSLRINMIHVSDHEFLVYPIMYHNKTPWWRIDPHIIFCKPTISKVNNCTDDCMISFKRGVVKTRNAGISRNFAEYAAISRNFAEYHGISRNITEFRGSCRIFKKLLN